MADLCKFTPRCPNESASEGDVLTSLARINVDLPLEGARYVRALRLVVVSALNAGACHACALRELRKMAAAASVLGEVAHG